MMKKIYDKYKTSIFIALIITFIGLIAILLLSISSSGNKIKEYENEYYKIKYDKSWFIKKKNKENIVLKNGNKSKVDIKVIDLEKELKYSSIDDLLDEVTYNIEKQNKNYKLISKKETLVSKNEYKGYKLLYENDNSEVMSTIYKKSDKLIVINYEADNNYFDILLDSVQNIIYNFNTKEEKYNLNNKINIDNKEINYSEDNNLDKEFKKQEKYEIADNNYIVNYSIPSNFELSEFNSQYNNFNLKDLEDKDIQMTAVIHKSNIFELLDKDSKYGVYTSYKSFKSNKDYSNYEDYVTKIDDNKYIYKCSYTYDKAVKYDKNFNRTEYKRNDENIKILYVLNKNHVFIVTLESQGTALTKKLINSINMDKFKNYSSYTTSKEENGLLVGELKRYSDSNRKMVDKVTISLPNKYSEIQKYNNVFNEKIYGINYDEEKDLYDYEISYKLTSTLAEVESQVSIINTSFSEIYGKCNYLTQKDNITLNGNKFIVYNGGYTQLGGIMFTNINRFEYYINKEVLFYKIDNGGYLIIEINGNGKEITNNILNDATNFIVKQVKK